MHSLAKKFSVRGIASLIGAVVWEREPEVEEVRDELYVDIYGDVYWLTTGISATGWCGLLSFGRFGITNGIVTAVLVVVEAFVA